MTKLFLILTLLPFSASASPNLRVTGPAAAELFDHLAIPAVAVREEHTGLQYAVAKYGKSVGCERALESDATDCWLASDTVTYPGTVGGATALEIFQLVDFAAGTIVDEHGNLVTGHSKSGKNFGCELGVDGRAGCWFR